MFNNLLYAVKRRILDEIRDSFNSHPQFAGKVKVVHKFAYKERVQYGVVLRNASASQTRLSADNYLGELRSHVTLGKVQNFPGNSIEWAREDSIHLTDYQKDENVTAQLGPTQREFITSHKPIVSGQGNTNLADNFRQVRVSINGVFSPDNVEFVDGASGTVLLRQAPLVTDTVTVSYWYRSLTLPGRYYVVFTSDTQFDVDPLYDVKNEIVIENTTGTETSAQLDHFPILDPTIDLYMKSRNGGSPINLRRGVDYTINTVTGAIHLLIALYKDFQLLANYRYPGDTMGPFTFEPYQEINSAIPGVVLSIGRRASAGDKQVIIVYNFREQAARIYGGHWQVSLNLGIISKDPQQMEEMVDFVVGELWGRKKNVLEFQGLTLNSVEPTGESEEVFNDVSGDMYYESAVDINIQTEWQLFVPYLFEIERFTFDYHGMPDNKSYYVTKENVLIPVPIEPDERQVVKYPIIGYERVI